MDFKLNKSNLNFRVYTASALPSTAQENDICIISDVPMKNWILSPDTPSGAPRTDGDVWIQYSVTGDTFNALKTGAMMVATISAWQYVNEVWATRTTKSYQEDEWSDRYIDGWIYTNGSEWEAVTGGIETVYNPTTTTGYIVKESDRIKFNLPTNQGFQSAIFTKNTMDLTNFTKLYAEIENCSVTSSVSPNMILGYSSGKTIENFVGKTKKTSASGNFTMEVDISEANGLYYIQLCAFQQKFDVVKIWME